MPSLCIAIFLIIIGINYSQSRGRNYCDYAERIFCLARPLNWKCGSDGKTYYNMCALSVAKCRDHSLHLSYSGLCKPQQTTVPSTTPKPTTILSTQDGVQLAYDIFCIDLFRFACPNQAVQELCASNNSTYLNLCEFDKARCTHRHLRVVKHGHC